MRYRTAELRALMKDEAHARVRGVRREARGGVFFWCAAAAAAPPKSAYAYAIVRAAMSLFSGSAICAALCSLRGLLSHSCDAVEQ